MKLDTFLAERPCPCECDGFLRGLRMPEVVGDPNGLRSTDEVVGPVLRWRKLVMAGDQMPSETQRWACTCFHYVRGGKPRPRQGPTATVPDPAGGMTVAPAAPATPAPKARPGRFGKPPPPKSRFG